MTRRHNADRQPDDPNLREESTARRPELSQTYRTVQLVTLHGGPSAILRYLFLDDELDVVLEAGMLARLHGPAIRAVTRRGAVVSLESTGGGFDFPFECRHAANEFHNAILQRMSTIWRNATSTQRDGDQD